MPRPPSASATWRGVRPSRVNDTVGTRRSIIRSSVMPRTHLVGGQALEVLLSTVEHAQVRPEELVRRDSQEITTESPDVDRPMRRVLHGINGAQCTGLRR